MPSIFRYLAIPVDTLFKGDQVNNIRVVKPLFPRGETESLIRHDDCLERSVMMFFEKQVLNGIATGNLLLFYKDYLKMATKLPEFMYLCLS